ncbi:hypothetical protein M3898_003460 [Vibrio metschnikovii]|uniref:Uncharacterized protein n=3 Tax=Unclassified Bacteria TaxID=49928 RepID=A0AAU6V102_UNCXX|nr:hypothetical protein [Vibrio metschnikovii]EKO3643260.1 hypothetical protein [Vibrio metschnikovii]EKO3667549.1 hypothetical protein [Vibrio metschnikovii]EKO3698549.1 hypothetical protein [Vibrio metschnikovii]EKO3719048.1 hypothetical protein [Vibrio metschnikovii]
MSRSSVAHTLMRRYVILSKFKLFNKKKMTEQINQEQPQLPGLNESVELRIEIFIKLVRVGFQPLK